MALSNPTRCYIRLCPVLCMAQPMTVFFPESCSKHLCACVFVCVCVCARNDNYRLCLGSQKALTHHGVIFFYFDWWWWPRQSCKGVRTRCVCLYVCAHHWWDGRLQLEPLGSSWSELVMTPCGHWLLTLFLLNRDCVVVFLRLDKAEVDSWCAPKAASSQRAVSERST